MSDVEPFEDDLPPQGDDDFDSLDEELGDENFENEELGEDAEYGEEEDGARQKIFTIDFHLTPEPQRSRSGPCK